ncbi:hypothetical protein GE09DRAFT_1223301 [Coniochaeta sp. 2T2.1]|nr:hypothetical protein GE09DRAFT_1223301 [Coniochaeta sp. 2T2.1]
MLAEPTVTVLGPDPAHRKCILNGNAFQQDAITSLNGWQYAAFYSSLSPDRPEPLFVHVARRKLPSFDWQILVLDDYPQTVDDGHNTVQIGICPGDGTIHLSYDHHCDILRYRYSVRKLAKYPGHFEWKADLFSPTLDYLPGLPSSHKHFGYVTYPRFGTMGEDMFCSFRDGKAGLGNDHLYLYKADSGRFYYVGTHLTGIQSNPYVHGMDYRNGRFHVTWVYREFVHYEGWDDPADTKHKQQAGPNGAENNHDICYAYSDDKGYTWRNGHGDIIASLKDGETITNKSPGIIALNIPKGTGLTNQESQAVDQEGRVHVLNRENYFGGHPLWTHYYRDPTDQWFREALHLNDGDHTRDFYAGKRGRVAVSRDGDVYFIVPDVTRSTLSILKTSEGHSSGHYDEIWTGGGLSGEPLIDIPRLEHDNVLSVFLRADVEGQPDKQNVVVLDFSLDST